VVSSYTVTVTDAVGCSATASVTLTQPTILRDSIVSIQQVYCYGDSSASVTFGETGGTPPYSYQWLNANAFGATATGLSAGTYTVYINDSRGCSLVDSVIITQPANLLSVSANQTSASSCNGGNTGSANSTVIGGYAPYTYLWSTGATTTVVNNLSGGTYTLSVTDSNGCTKTVSVAITQPNAINPNVSTVNITCNGGSNGSAIASPTGGTSPFSYLWSDANTTTTASISSLTLGSYTVTVSDANSCSATASITIAQPAVFLYASAGTVSNITCNGANNGKATVNAVGGGIPYTYAWSNGTSTVSTIQSPSILSAGNYTVTVTDNCGVSHTSTANISQPNAMRDSVKTITNVGCSGGNGGSIALGAKGGNYPYRYTWSNGSTLVTAANLTAGTYSVVVTDTKGCTNTVTGIVVTQPSVLGSNISANCIGNRQGILTITGSGGTPAYKYTWSNGKTTSSVTVADGAYTVKLSDAHSCIATNSVTVACPGALKEDVESPAPATCCPTIDNISLYPNPNNGKFAIQWSVAGDLWSVEIYNVLGQKVYAQSTIHQTQSTINISDKASGIYLIRVLDNTGNLVSQKKVIKTN